jgi:hypothetical protein
MSMSVYDLDEDAARRGVSEADSARHQATKDASAKRRRLLRLIIAGICFLIAALWITVGAPSTAGLQLDDPNFKWRLLGELVFLASSVAGIVALIAARR